MPSNPPEGTPRISPYLLYEDLDAAMDWLEEAFGFEVKMRIKGDEGKATHGEMRLADGMVMMGCPGPDYRNPKHLGAATQCLYVYVDGVDAHFDRARAAGARILSEPEDQYYGDRRYGCEDPEGHQWFFGEHFRDVPPEEMPGAETS